MNVNRVYRELFEHGPLGLTVLGLDDKFPDLIRLVEDKTLSSFSDSIPALYPLHLDLRNPQRIVQKSYPTRGREYYLDDPVLDRFNLEILGIRSIKPQYMNGSDPYDPEAAELNEAIIMAHDSMNFWDMLLSSQYTSYKTMAASAMPYQRHHELRGHRILYLENWGQVDEIEVMCEVRWPNLVSIPEEYHQIFVRLATFDIQIYLWQDMKYIEDVVTPRGNLSLRVNWDDAAERREDYLKELRAKTLPDRVGAQYFHVI